MVSPRRLGGRGGLAVLLALVVVTGATAAPSGPPVRIGGTLALTGPLAPTALREALAATGAALARHHGPRPGSLPSPA